MSFPRYLANEFAENLSFFGPTTSSYSIRVNQKQLETFASEWPMSKSQNLSSFQADFGSNGDLLDYRCYVKTHEPVYSDIAVDCDDTLSVDFDMSGEALALINDMQCGAALAGLIKLNHCRDRDQFMGDY